ncbi:hypothetical protein J5U18_03495 [Sphingobacteriaceae bacterium WQ 2009]|uniref:Uncharacterized protein n=1 Tax=Rhinopithecimicrobium faecis TaxID=2820698 RepID=A0A8T4H774_9SPHI|nr:hypothetical protein [Sphingobacteriaceae bacterium WQ 2009]
MGTSKPNIGPKGISSPLPSWPDYNDTNNEEGSNLQEEINNVESENELKPWSDVKRSYTKFIKDPSKTSFKKLTANYRNANGGNKTLAKSSFGGRKGARILLRFLSSVSQKGFEEACKEFHLEDLKGVSTEDAINKLCFLFADIDGTDEGSAAKAAAIETISLLYENYEVDSNNINGVEEGQVLEYLEIYISNYIFERLSIEVSRALESDKFTKDQVITANDILKDYIQAEVELHFSIKDFSSSTIREQNTMVTEILTQAYSMI